MAEIQQQLKLGQQLVMTPQLQQAIKLLQLSRIELIDMINEEMEQNPLLEEQEDLQEEEKKTEKKEEQEVTFDENIKQDSDWENYLNEYNSIDRVSYETEAKQTVQYENFISDKKTLRDHLLWQLKMSNISKEEQNLGYLIIGNLNKDGYLNISLKEISEKFSVNIKSLTKMLSIVQNFDPIGIASRDIKECLLIQINHLKIDMPFLKTIVNDYLGALENRQYKKICKELKITLEDISDILKTIKTLEPKPGRIFNLEETVYVVPDLFVYKYDGEFIIALNDEGIPNLIVNKGYLDSFSKTKSNSNTTKLEETKSYIQEKHKSASWMIKSIRQRQQTIYNVMKSILKFQKDFFEKGINHLKPMILKDVAEDIEMHESTISRITTNKYVHTPQGIFELKYFFNSSIKRTFGETIASASVQDKIKKIIKTENAKKPYSDEQIMEILKKANVSIARRTIAKYRNILGILPASKRKNLLDI